MNYGLFFFVVGRSVYCICRLRREFTFSCYSFVRSKALSMKLFDQTIALTVDQKHRIENFDKNYQFIFCYVEFTSVHEVNDFV